MAATRSNLQDKLLRSLLTMPETRAICVCTVSLLLMTADSKSLLRNCNFTVITLAEPWYSVLSVSHASFAEFVATIIENTVSSTAYSMKNKAFASLFGFSLFVVSSDVESAHPLSTKSHRS
ncbi:hypothetical protein Tco_0104296 [Tanacetum coccineum]